MPADRSVRPTVSKGEMPADTKVCLTVSKGDDSYEEAPDFNADGDCAAGRARLHVLELFVARWSSTAVPAVRAALRHPRSKRLLRRVRRRVRRRMLRWLCRWLFQLWRRAGGCHRSDGCAVTRTGTVPGRTHSLIRRNVNVKRLLILTTLATALAAAGGCHVCECWDYAWNSHRQPRCAAQPCGQTCTPCVVTDSCCSECGPTIIAPSPGGCGCGCGH